MLRHGNRLLLFPWLIPVSLLATDTVPVCQNVGNCSPSAPMNLQLFQRTETKCLTDTSKPTTYSSQCGTSVGDINICAKFRLAGHSIELFSPACSSNLQWTKPCKPLTSTSLCIRVNSTSCAAPQVEEISHRKQIFQEFDIFCRQVIVMKPFSTNSRSALAEQAAVGRDRRVPLTTSTGAREPGHPGGGDALQERQKLPYVLGAQRWTRGKIRRAR